jgi:hypothetical protein
MAARYSISALAAAGLLHVRTGERISAYGWMNDATTSSRFFGAGELADLHRKVGLRGPFDD